MILLNVCSRYQRHIQYKLKISVQQEAEDAEVCRGWLISKITTKKLFIHSSVCLLLRILVWADNPPAIFCLDIFSRKIQGNSVFWNQELLSFCQPFTVQPTVCFLWSGSVTVKISTEHIY